MKVVRNSVIHSVRFFPVALVLLFILCNSVDAQRMEAAEAGKNILLADPTIFFDRGVYYLYGTSGKANDGFVVYTSRDMKIWEGPSGLADGFALKKGESFGIARFWAPQLLRYRKQFYMAYAADERIAIAKSESPLGPFVQNDKTALSATIKQIDPFIFLDSDGRKYLYHVRVGNGANRIFVAEMDDDLSEVKMHTLKECIAATETWENTGQEKWPVIEGPTVLKHKGLYYLIYSANHFRSHDYAVGYAVSKSPYGPWTKYEGNPILSRANTGENGSGHGDVVTDQKGNMFYVFHTHQSNSTIGPRKTALVKISFSDDNKTGIDKLRIDEASFYFLKTKE